jgi:hypothetical protein
MNATSKPWPFPAHTSIAEVEKEADRFKAEFKALDERGRELAWLHLKAISKMCEGCKK